MSNIESENHGGCIVGSERTKTLDFYGVLWDTYKVVPFCSSSRVQLVRL